MRSCVHPGPWPSPERREQHGTGSHCKGRSLFRNHSPAEERKEEEKMQAKTLDTLLSQQQQYRWYLKMLLNVKLKQKRLDVLKKMHRTEVKMWTFQFGKSIWYWRLALRESTVIKDLQCNAHRVCNTLRSLSLPGSSSVDQASAVNHTCSFTDACVGGSESKITERLCVCTWHVGFCVCGRLKDWKENGREWLRDEGKRTRYLCSYLWSRTRMNADKRWDADCDVNGADGLKQRDADKENDSAARDYYAGVHCWEQIPFWVPQAENKLSVAGGWVTSVNSSDSYSCHLLFLITVAYVGARLIYNSSDALLISTLRHAIR